MGIPKPSKPCNQKVSCLDSGLFLFPRIGFWNPFSVATTPKIIPLTARILQSEKILKKNLPADYLNAVFVGRQSFFTTARQS